MIRRSERQYGRHGNGKLTLDRPGRGDCDVFHQQGVGADGKVWPMLFGRRYGRHNYAVNEHIMGSVSGEITKAYGIMLCLHQIYPYTKLANVLIVKIQWD